MLSVVRVSVCVNEHCGLIRFLQKYLEILSVIFAFSILVCNFVVCISCIALTTCLNRKRPYNM